MPRMTGSVLLLKGKVKVHQVVVVIKSGHEAIRNFSSESLDVPMIQNDIHCKTIIPFKGKSVENDKLEDQNRRNYVTSAALGDVA